MGCQIAEESDQRIGWRTITIEPKRTGSVAELAVAKKLVERGFTVSWPLNEDSYDLIAEKDGKARRIQVKSANINKGGSYRCGLTHCRTKNLSYTKSDCDFIILFAPYSWDFEDMIRDGYYIIPVEDAAKGGQSIAVLFPAGKGRGRIKISRWEKYKDGWERI